MVVNYHHILGRFAMCSLNALIVSTMTPAIVWSITDFGIHPWRKDWKDYIMLNKARKEKVIQATIQLDYNEQSEWILFYRL